jgi:KDO2-lipid IV(A) lauroyltransferase
MLHKINEAIIKVEVISINVFVILMTLKDKITYQFLNVMARRLRRLSYSSRERLANKLGAFAYNRITIRKKEAFNNIKKAFPDKSNNWVNGILRKNYSLVASNFLEFMAMPKSTESINFRVEGQQILDEAIQFGKGTILVTAHYGLWEQWGAWLGTKNYPTWGIIQRQGNAGADLFFKDLRESYGMNHIYRKSSIEHMYELLNKNKILIIASDQDAKSKGVFVNFFGHPTSTPKGTALFQMKTGCPLIFSVAKKEKDGTIVISFSKIKIDSNPSIESITQSYTNMLEEKIRENPDHYFWFHRKWKTIKTT